MREIKFRAWHTVYEIWLKITGFETHISDDGKTASINTGLGGMFHDGDYIGTFQKHGGEQNNVILSQYTGLKDKNGREIFEGDILEVNHPTNKAFSGVFTVEISPETMNFVVGAFNLGSGVYKYGKVIGNIYENPEMLEGEGA